MLIELMKALRGADRFFNGPFNEMERLFHYLSKGQHPEILFVTCSDSRLDPNLFTQSDPGTFFNIRNVGNIIPPNTVPSSEAAAIEYAVTLLDVKHIIICGHSQCGAISELLHPKHSTALPSLTSWLSHSHSVTEQMNTEFPDMEDGALKREIAAKKNVLIQIEHLKTYPVIAEKMKQKQLTLNSWYYQFETGEIFIYNTKENDFVRFDIALQQLIDERTEHVVKDAVTGYLETLSHPQTIEEYHDSMSLLSQLKFNLEPVWQQIKKPITQNLWLELGGLYSSIDDAEFMLLVTQSRAMVLDNLKSFHEKIEQSKGYSKYCSQLISDYGFLKPPFSNGTARIEPNGQSTIHTQGSLHI